MQTTVMNTSKEKLVVEVVGAHNLIPKDGGGSSSPFVEVEFNGQTLRTEVKHKELNPIWNEKLVFNVEEIGDLPYKSIEVNVFNEKKSNSSRHFLGKVRVSGTSVAREGEAVAQPFVLDKRTLFSHVRGEISLKLYVSSVEEVKDVVDASKIKNGGGKTMSFRKNKKGGNRVVLMQQKQQPQQLLIGGGGGGGGGYNSSLMNGGQNQINAKQMNPISGNMKPVIITNNNSSIVPVGGGGGGGMILGGGGRMGGGVIPTGQNDYSLKETRPHLGGGPLNKDKTSSTYDLVEQVQYLYVRIVKARENSNFGVNEVTAEVKLGNYRGVAKRVPSNNAEWDQVFAFSKDNIQSSFVEVFVKESNKDEFLGRALFDLNEVPKRMQPDSQLAPHWCRMEDKKGDKVKGGEIMVAIWFGTQADEAFAEAWHSKAASVHLDGLSSIKSKVYLSPKLWYLRVGVIEAQDVVSGDKGSSIMRYPELLAKIQVGNQVLKTRVASPTANRSLSSPFWNEDLMFVVAEPFEDYLLVSVEDRIGPNREEVVGRLLLPLTSIERRLDEKPVAARWYNLDMHFSNANDPKSVRFASRIHIRASLDGGYHVLDEATMYSSDVRPTAKQLWKPHIGVLEVGVLGASNLIPMKVKEGKGGATDAYCVAKYGQKWVRTRTVVDSLAPRWNEQYTWEVFDPCTVITIGVFDNSLVGKSAAFSMGNHDTRIGKVRIRLSTLETDKVYTHAYPLLMLHPSGVKKMGELHLAVRFTCANMPNMMHMYTQPFLPKMHYTQPISINQLEALRYQATNVIASRLSRAEPPLGREVVEYMLDHDTHMWSMRKSKANFFRLTSVLSWFFVMSRFLETMRSWNQPVYSTSFLIVFLILVLAPEIIIPCVLLTISVVGLCRYRSRPRHPPHMDTRLSCAETILSDELDEEFDSFPTSRNPDIVRNRYDRLRSVARRIQTVVGDMATQGERFEALLSWRDPRATFLFIIFCIVAAFVFYLVPVGWIVALWGLYYLRPPKYRSKLPSPTLSFLKRLPTKADSML